MMKTDRRPSRRNPRLLSALLVAKTVAKGIQIAGRGGGTSAPGLVADRIDTTLLTRLTDRLAHGVVMVAGTNGKTTTSRMIADLLEGGGMAPVHNRSGSNLVRGVVSAFARQARLNGDPGGDVGVIEADEAALPALLERVSPRVLLLNNLFRDQLDRYGELDTIARMWRPAIERLDPDSTIIVNADDPTLASLTTGVAARVIRFGFHEERHRLESLSHASDAASCRECGADLAYHALYVSHLGNWYCPACGNRRPALDVNGSAIQLNGVESLDMTVHDADGDHSLHVGVPGVYNAYNVLAAVAVGRVMSMPMPIVIEAMGAFRSAFGRIERVTYRERTLTLALVKNPVGFNEVLRMLTASTGGLEVPTLIAINDLYADGRDVSWLWDVDFALLADGGTEPTRSTRADTEVRPYRQDLGRSLLATTGIRGADMANRLKYAGVGEDRLTPLPEELGRALDAFVERIPSGSAGYILPTYTAMLQLRKILADRGAVESFWKQ